jgi:hypothetical protein
MSVPKQFAGERCAGRTLEPPPPTPPRKGEGSRAPGLPYGSAVAAAMWVALCVTPAVAAEKIT